MHRPDEVLGGLGTGCLERRVPELGDGTGRGATAKSTGGGAQKTPQLSSLRFAQSDWACPARRKAFQIFDVRQKMHGNSSDHITRIAQVLDCLGFRRSTPISKRRNK